tara:strand:+ start:46 stop:261 length:216 start_codon:yes stop_codon:yes gene_type:complete
MIDEIEKKCEGECPKCGSLNLDYDTMKVDCGYVSYDYDCNDCKNHGTEYFNLVYDVTVTNNYNKNEKLSSI